MTRFVKSDSTNCIFPALNLHRNRSSHSGHSGSHWAKAAVMPSERDRLIQFIIGYGKRVRRGVRRWSGSHHCRISVASLLLCDLAPNAPGPFVTDRAEKWPHGGWGLQYTCERPRKVAWFIKNWFMLLLYTFKGHFYKTLLFIPDFLLISGIAGTVKPLPMNWLVGSLSLGQ